MKKLINGLGYFIFFCATYLASAGAFTGFFVACTPPAKIYETEAVEPSPSACAGYMVYPQMTLQKTAGAHYNFSLYVMKTGSYRSLNFPNGTLTNLSLARSQGLISPGANTAGVAPDKSRRGYCTTGTLKGDPCLVELWEAPSCWLSEEAKAPGADTAPAGD